ncbi:MAG: methyltransferase domain-containing protein [Desulfobulbaceae bacterium]|nr:methyltransferase domain-containing protein [Desulfobulbaceae bacterium]
MKEQTENKESKAWTSYWARVSQTSTGCLPDLPRTVSDFMDRVWADFFEALPAGARLLDIGTGSGAVLALGRTRRSDLELSGIDYAATLPDLGRDIALYPGARFESLPFCDNSFEAVTSQFALEYGRPVETVAEIQRVLNNRGAFLIICHHAESVIVQDNVRRLGAIRDLISLKGLLNSAIKAARKNKANDPGKRKKLSRLLRAAQMKHPDEPLVNEIAELAAGFMAGPDGAKKLQTLRRDLEMEGRRIALAWKITSLIDSHQGAGGRS